MGKNQADYWVSFPIPVEIKRGKQKLCSSVCLTDILDSPKESDLDQFENVELDEDYPTVLTTV